GKLVIAATSNFRSAYSAWYSCPPRYAGSPIAAHKARNSSFDLPSSSMDSFAVAARAAAQSPYRISCFDRVFLVSRRSFPFVQRYNFLAMPNQLAVEQLSIADWVKGLTAIPERDFTLETVQDYIVRHAVRPETLEKYCYFSKGNYTRNLIFKNDLFE